MIIYKVSQKLFCSLGSGMCSIGCNTVRKLFWFLKPVSGFQAFPSSALSRKKKNVFYEKKSIEKYFCCSNQCFNDCGNYFHLPPPYVMEKKNTEKSSRKAIYYLKMLYKKWILIWNIKDFDKKKVLWKKIYYGYGIEEARAE